jgi:hypothetical protein
MCGRISFAPNAQLIPTLSSGACDQFHAASTVAPTGAAGSIGDRQRRDPERLAFVEEFRDAWRL